MVWTEEWTSIAVVTRVNPGDRSRTVTLTRHWQNPSWLKRKLFQKILCLRCPRVTWQRSLTLLGLPGEVSDLRKNFILLMQEGPVIICYVVWEKGEFGEDHMVFRWSGRGISLRQQSLTGDLSKLTASWMPVRWDQVTQPNPLTPQMINNKRSPVDPVYPVSVGCLLFLVHALPWKVYAFPLFCFPVSGRGIHAMTAGSDAWSLVGTWKCCGQ